MIVIKRYFFQHNSSVTTPKDVIFVDTIEKLDDANYPIFTWTCSVLLSAYLFHQKHSQNPIIILDHSTNIIELGAGTALPSLLCGKLGVRHCYITERSDQPDMLQHIEESINLNKVQINSSVVPLSWGYHAYERFEDIPTVDLILGADIFYSDEDFDLILFNVFQLMVKNPRAIFLSSYQQRDSFYSIEHLLIKYGLTAEYISKNEFLDHSHGDGQCQVLVSQESGVEIHGTVSLDTFDEIYLIKVALRALDKA